MNARERRSTRLQLQYALPWLQAWWGWEGEGITCWLGVVACLQVWLRCSQKDAKQALAVRCAVFQCASVFVC